MINIQEKIIAAIGGHRHKHYDLMVEIADWSKAMMTGEGQEEMIKEIRKGESEENIEQRLAVTVPRTPEVLSPAETIYRKTFRVDGIKESYGSDTDKDTVAEIKNKAHRFYGNKSLYHYLQQQQLFYEFHDPNAWFMVEFEPVMNAEGVLVDVNPYPLELTSHEVIDYDYSRGLPEYVISLRTRMEMNAKKHLVKLETYAAYVIGGSVVYREELSPQENGYIYVGGDRKERYFAVEEYQNNLDFFPGEKFGAYRCGTVSDTTVKAPPYYSARHVLKRVVRGGSLKDVCKWKHVYPKLFGLDFDCEYESEAGDCNGNGYLGDNTQAPCPSCKGTGSMLHSSELDNVRYKVATGAMKDEIIPANAFYSYARSPLDETQWISADLAADMMQVALTMFNTNIEQKPVVPTTATAELLNWENVNNEVFTFASHTSYLAEMAINTIAGYLEINVAYNHSYPKNLGLTPLAILQEQYSSAIEKGLIALAEAIFCEILSKQYSDDPEVVERHRALQMHNPEKGRAYDRVYQIMQQRDPEDLDRIKFENWPRISTLVDVRLPNFGRLSFDRQSKEIDAIANEIAGKIKPLKDDFAAMVTLEEPEPGELETEEI